MSDWIQLLTTIRRKARLVVLVTVASIKGSVPREPGAKMLVTADSVHGTIGGGHLEFKAIDIARDMLESSGTAAVHRFPLGASLGQCCGGLVNLLFEPVPTSAEWVDELAELLARGEDCIAVTPAHGDAYTGKLLVTPGSRSGTLGSVSLDSEAERIARDLLAGASGSTLVDVAVAPGLAHLCFFDALRAPDFRLVLFGAGHVGRALVRALADLPCRITWVDSREEEFPHELPLNVEAVVTDIPEAEVDAAAPGSYFLVMTHSHALDQQLSECILRRTDFAYFGLIGSLSKRRQFEKRMEQRGLAPTRFASMTCPIGVAGISGKQPAAIAIAVAAELLQIHEQRLAAQQPVRARRA